jgi:hypothetical protein
VALAVRRLVALVALVELQVLALFVLLPAAQQEQ